VPADRRRRAAASRLGKAFVVEPHRGALDGTDNFIGAGGFKVHIDRIGARAANDALGSHCLQGRVVDLGVERDELGHDRDRPLVHDAHQPFGEAIGRHRGDVHAETGQFLGGRAIEHGRAEHDAAQQQRSAGKLRQARASLHICSREVCPAIVKSDCTQWLSEVEASVMVVIQCGWNELKSVRHRSVADRLGWDCFRTGVNVEACDA